MYRCKNNEISYLLDFSQFIEGDHFSKVYSSSQTTNIELFYKIRGWCPFCKKEAPQVHDEHDESSNRLNENIGFMSHAWSCNTCGWWETYYHYYYGLLDDIVDNKKVRHAILRRYDIDNAFVPINLLRKELVRKSKLIFEIHPNKMEELVQSVFADFFACEVVLCGRSHDGGVDLYLVLGDEICLVQVKRRSIPDKAEPVSTVRELLGVMGLQEQKWGIVVTSADHFSKSAIDAQKQALTVGMVNGFELIDGHRFLAMLNLVKDSLRDPWRDYLFR